VTSQESFIKRQPVLWYYIFVFAISWGGILLALGPGGFLGLTATPETQLMVGGPISLLGPSISGLLMTAILYGRAGLRELLSRLLKWRVGAGWYAFALLLAPLLNTAVLLALGKTPAIATAGDKLGLLLSGIGFGLVVPFFEEMGWTGFATPELRKRLGVLSTGLIMGVLWGLWHFPMFCASAWASVSPAPGLMALVLLFSWLIPYRVLMVWVYEHTRSLLLGMLMHLPIVAATVVLAPPAQSSAEIAAQNLTFTAALWTVAAVIYAAKRGKLEASAVPVAA
jgi:membrane protease YdiL (CAAX protease family)